MNMRKNMYVVLALLLILVSCDNSKDPDLVKNVIQVKVYNVKTWNSVTDRMDTVAGANVTLFSDSVNYTKGTVVATNNKGIASFSLVKERIYYIIASSGNLSNMINEQTIDGNLLGNLIVGVYKSQEDINSSAANPGAIVGGSKIYDANGDGRITSNDVVRGVTVDYKEKYKDVNGDGVIDVKDLVNGALVKLDQVVNVSVYIGN